MTHLNAFCVNNAHDFTFQEMICLWHTTFTTNMSKWNGDKWNAYICASHCRLSSSNANMKFTSISWIFCLWWLPSASTNTGHRSCCHSISYFVVSFCLPFIYIVSGVRVDVVVARFYILFVALIVTNCQCKYVCVCVHIVYRPLTEETTHKSLFVIFIIWFHTDVHWHEHDYIYGGALIVTLWCTSV